jgi:hypothetical protein
MFQELLEALAQELEARAIPYMLIGGQAVLLYGVPRLTEDVDVTTSATLSAGHFGYAQCRPWMPARRRSPECCKSSSAWVGTSW